jgi:hypothetical protein
MGAPDSPVRHRTLSGAPATSPNRWSSDSLGHRTSQCRTGQSLFTIGALTAWATGQSGAALDSHCSLSGAPFGATLTQRELSAQCSHCRRPLESTVALGSRCSAGTPDSPVNYSGARPQKPEGEEFEVDSPWCTGGTPDSPVRQTRVHFGFFCSFLLNPNFNLFIGLC